MAEVTLTIPEIEKLRESLGHNARFVNSHKVIAAVEQIVAGRLDAHECCEVEWRNANGLPIRYRVTHGQDYPNCKEANDD